MIKKIDKIIFVRYPFISLKIRYFSDDKKNQITNCLRRSYMAVTILDIHVRLVVESLREIEVIEQEHVAKTELTVDEEVIGYNIKKKFYAAEREVDSIIWDQLRKIDGVVSELKTKPAWLLKEDEKKILEDLRDVVVRFFSAVEFLRRSGERYICLRAVSVDNVFRNKISQYGLEMKLNLARFSIILKSDFLPYICLILKEIQVKWSWMSDEEKEDLRLKLQARYEEKVAVAKKRKQERLAIERRNRIYMRLMRGWTK